MSEWTKTPYFFLHLNTEKKETKGNVLLEIISFPHLSWYLLLPSPPQSFLIEFSCSIVEKKRIPALSTPLRKPSPTDNIYSFCQ